jgi:hypothetical protein
MILDSLRINHKMAEKMRILSRRLLLQNLGYEAIALTNSNKTLETFRTYPDQFDLIIADQTRPHLSDDALAKEMLKIRPKMPIISLL